MKKLWRNVETLLEQGYSRKQAVLAARVHAGLDDLDSLVDWDVIEGTPKGMRQVWPKQPTERDELFDLVESLNTQ